MLEPPLTSPNRSTIIRPNWKNKPARLWQASQSIRHRWQKPSVAVNCSLRFYTNWRIQMRAWGRWQLRWSVKWQNKVHNWLSSSWRQGVSLLWSTSSTKTKMRTGCRGSLPWGMWELTTRSQRWPSSTAREWPLSRTPSSKSLMIWSRGLPHGHSVKLAAILALTPMHWPENRSLLIFWQYTFTATALSSWKRRRRRHSRTSSSCALNYPPLNQS